MVNVVVTFARRDGGAYGTLRVALDVQAVVAGAEIDVGGAVGIQIHLVIAFASSHGLVAADDAVIAGSADQHGVVAGAEVGGVVARTGHGQLVVTQTHGEAVATRDITGRPAGVRVVGTCVGNDIIARAANDQVIVHAGDDGVVAIAAIDESDAGAGADPVVTFAERDVLGVVGGAKLDMVVLHGADIDDFLDSGLRRRQ